MTRERLNHLRRLLGFTVITSEEPPSYHDLHITTARIPRTSIFNLSYGLMVQCTRVSGWELWDCTAGSDISKWRIMAGEYAGPEEWLILDVDGHVIVNSRDRKDDGDE